MTILLLLKILEADLKQKERSLANAEWEYKNATAALEKAKRTRVLLGDGSPASQAAADKPTLGDGTVREG